MRGGRPRVFQPTAQRDAPRLETGIDVHWGRTMNRWRIPDWLEEEVRVRDKTCVYCGVRMIEQVPLRGSRKAMATWEHIVNDARIVSRENIARCYAACNSSKGTKHLSDWIQSHYCRRRGIGKDTVATVVKEALRAAESEGRGITK